MAHARERRPIVAGVDPDPGKRMPLAWASDAAARRRLPLLLVLAQNVPTAGYRPTNGRPSWEEWNEALHATGDRALKEAVAFVESRHPRVRVSGVLAEGHPAWVLREQGQNATEVVLGSWHLSALQELFSAAAVALPLIAHAPCPVVVVPEPEHITQQPPYFVVGVDGSPQSAAAVDFAFEEAAPSRRGPAGPVRVAPSAARRPGRGRGRPGVPATAVGDGRRVHRRPPGGGTAPRGRTRPPGTGPHEGVRTRPRPGRGHTRARRLHRHAAGLRQPGRTAPRALPGHHRPARVQPVARSSPEGALHAGTRNASHVPARVRRRPRDADRSARGAGVGPGRTGGARHAVLPACGEFVPDASPARWGVSDGLNRGGEVGSYCSGNKNGHPPGFVRVRRAAFEAMGGLDCLTVSRCGLV